LSKCDYDLYVPDWKLNVLLINSEFQTMMATIQKQKAAKKGRKRFKKLFSDIRGQVSVWDIFTVVQCCAFLTVFLYTFCIYASTFLVQF